MRLSDLVGTSERMAATAGRSEKVERLAELLRRLERDEVPVAVAWLTGDLRQGRFGLGRSAIRAALDDPRDPDAPPSLFDDVARAPEPPVPTLSVSEVDAAFEGMAAIRGPGAAQGRARRLRELFGRATASERSFLVRLIFGEIRQGALRGVMEEAIARASGTPLPELRRAAMVAGSLERVAVAALAEGPQGLAPFRVQLFRPVLPMLAQTAAGLDEALDRLGTALLEHKLDGARIQIHRDGDEVRVYSRSLNEVTLAVPEVVEAVARLPLRDAILDGEAIALAADGRPLPFQMTMRRFGRTLDVERQRHELPLSTFLFDALRLDGTDLFDVPARERSATLRRHAPHLAVAQRTTADRGQAAAFLDEALAAGHEGIMAKDPESRYEAGGRGFAWLKIKPAHTLDLVVLAAEWGNGRRTGWLSNIHLGARDPAGGFVMLGKTFKGMTDEMLEWQTRTFPALAQRTEGNVVYLRPEIVVEVDVSDVQESPRYPGGMALRLARVKAYRPDKSPMEADTLDTVRAIQRGQRARGR